MQKAEEYIYTENIYNQQCKKRKSIYNELHNVFLRATRAEIKAEYSMWFNIDVYVYIEKCLIFTEKYLQSTMQKVEEYIQ